MIYGGRYQCVQDLNVILKRSLHYKALKCSLLLYVAIYWRLLGGNKSIERVEASIVKDEYTDGNLYMLTI